MGRAAFIFGVGLAALAANHAAAATATVQARAVIVEGNVVRMNWSTAMPSVRGGVEGAVFRGNAPSMMMGMMMLPGNARLSIRPDGQEPPVTVPTSFEVVSTEGGDALIVRTAADAEVRIASDGALVGGSLQGSSAASVGVGYSLARVSSFAAAPPPVRETLVIMVQYN